MIYPIYFENGIYLLSVTLAILSQKLLDEFVSGDGAVII